MIQAHAQLRRPTEADLQRRMIVYQYRAYRARRTLKAIDQQIVKAEKAVAVRAAVEPNRFVQLAGGTKSVNRGLEAKAGQAEGLHHQPAGPDRRVRDGRLPPVVANREELPHFQRPTCGPGRSTTTNATRSRSTSPLCPIDFRS
jgi:hypothetical protein